MADRVHLRLRAFPPMVLRRLGDLDRLVTFVAKEMAGEGRHHHTLEHVAEMLEDLALAVERREVALACVPEMIAAVLFHDIIYDPSSNDSEDRSAELGGEYVNAYFYGVDAGEVKHLILLTAHHANPPSRLRVDEKVFLDLDRAVLGSDPARYDRYADAIRAEFIPFVGDAAYREGRSQFLRSILSQERVFLTDWMEAARGASARANLQRELDRIQV